MLVCAVLASLASGVLVAYAVCVVLFSFFRTRSGQWANQRTAPSKARPAEAASLKG
jgi:uncharacterized protein (DUF2062 family)